MPYIYSAGLRGPTTVWLSRNKQTGKEQHIIGSRTGGDYFGHLGREIKQEGQRGKQIIVYIDNSGTDNGRKDVILILLVYCIVQAAPHSTGSQRAARDPWGSLRGLQGVPS